MNINPYGETVLNSKLYDTDAKIPIYFSEKPKIDGSLTSLVSTANQYVTYSKFLYNNEKESLANRGHPIFIVQEKETKDIDPFQAMLSNTTDEDLSKTDNELEKLTSALNANLRKKRNDGLEDERISFIKCPPGSNVTQVSLAESRLTDTIKMQEHLSMMICHAMQVPIDLLFHNLTHQTDAKILASQRNFKKKVDIYERHALAIAQKAFVLCFAKFEDFNEEDGGANSLKIYFMLEDEEDKELLKKEGELFEKVNKTGFEAAEPLLSQKLAQPPAAPLPP